MEISYNLAMLEKDKIIIYCDGACSGNQNRINTGGWGAILKYKGKVKEICGGEADTTNQRMELTACIRALEEIKTSGYMIDIYTDSAYLANCILQKWYVKWQKNGWKNAKKEPVENRDLWEKIISLLSLHKVTFHKVAGHSGNELNEKADELARTGIATVKKQPG